MSLSLPYSHLLYLEFYFRSSLQSEFLDLLTPKSGQNQELEEPRAPKKLLEPHESTTWQHLSFEYVDWQMCCTIRVSTNTTSTTLRFRKSTRVKLSCKGEKNTHQDEGDAEKREQHASLTHNVNNALFKRNASAKGYWNTFYPLSWLLGGNFKYNRTLSTRTTKFRKLEYRTPHNLTLATWRQFYSIRDTFLEALLKEAYL